MKKIIVLSLSLFLVLVAAAQTENADSTVAVQQLRFGFISYSEAIKAMPEYESAMTSLQDLKDSYDKELQRAEQDFSRKFGEFVEGQKNFPENILLKRQKELQQLMDESIKFKAEAQQMLTQSEQELMQPLHDRLKQVLAMVGTEKGLAFILNTDNNAYPFLNTNTVAEDCTDAVVAKLAK